MTHTEAVAEFKTLIRSREALIIMYQNKRSWKPSEKACSIAEAKKQIEALKLAIQLFQGSDHARV